MFSIALLTFFCTGLLWSFFFRRFAVPVLVIVLVWHYLLYGLIVDSDSLIDAEYHYWLPLTAIMGVTAGYLMSSLMNLRRLIFVRFFDFYGCWLPLILIEFIMMHAVLLIWETTGTFIRPVNFIVTFVLYLILIPIWYFMTNSFSVWGFFDHTTEKVSYKDHAALKFYGSWYLYMLSATIIFTVIEWAWPGVWPFWIALGTFAFQSLVWLLISVFIIDTVASATAEAHYKQTRDKLARGISNVPTIFPWPWLSSPSSANVAHESNGGVELDILDTNVRKSRKPTSAYAPLRSVQASDVREEVV